MTERWAPIPGYEGFYEASDQGRVRSVDRMVVVKTRWGATCWRKYPGRILKQAMRGYREMYPYVNLKRSGKQESMSVHRAVLLAFVGPPDDPTHEALHGPNHDPSDNRLCNLRWGSHEENNDDRNRVNGYCGYDAVEYLRAQEEVDAQARREGWDGEHREDEPLNGVPF